MTVHANEHTATAADLRRLLRAQRPDWASLPLRLAGHGTDNVMIRLGAELVARFPRVPSAVPDLDKDAAWLPALAPRLPLRIPQVVFRGAPDRQHPLPWAVYRWIDGAEPGPETVSDWARFGRDLAEFVHALHSIPVPADDPVPTSSRGALLGTDLAWGLRAIEKIRVSPCGEGMDLDALERMWRDLADTPQREAPQVWLHGDLRGDNLLVHGGKLCGVIDFGMLGIGQPAAEHGNIWEFPRAARDSYRDSLHLDEATWRLGRGWAMLPSLTGLPYYWHSYPEFAQLCRRRLATLLLHES